VDSTELLGYRRSLSEGCGVVGTGHEPALDAHEKRLAKLFDCLVSLRPLSARRGEMRRPGFLGRVELRERQHFVEPRTLVRRMRTGGLERRRLLMAANSLSERVLFAMKRRELIPCLHHIGG